MTKSIDYMDQLPLEAFNDLQGHFNALCQQHPPLDHEWAALIMTLVDLLNQRGISPESV